jgi:hypothetical protein
MSSWTIAPRIAKIFEIIEIEAIKIQSKLFKRLATNLKNISS